MGQSLYIIHPKLPISTLKNLHTKSLALKAGLFYCSEFTE